MSKIDSNRHRGSELCNTAVAGPDLANQSSPIKNAAGAASDSATEIALIKLLLAFGLIVILIEASLAYIAHWEAELTHRMIGLTLVVIIAVILIPVGYLDTQTAPIFGLLGMIVGYLLGSHVSSVKEFMKI